MSPTAIQTALNTPPPTTPGGRLDGKYGLDKADGVPTDYGRVPPRTTLYTLRTAEARGARGWQPSGLVDWTDITRAIDGADTTATLQAAGLDGDRIAEEHFADIVDRFGPGTRVRITAAYGKHGEEILFEGFCQPVTIRWAPMRQTVMVTALDAGQEYLRCGEHQQITGRYLRRHPERAWDQTQPDHVCCTALPVTFNPSLLANREPEPCVWVMPDDYMCQAHLWTTDGHPDAQRWTYLQALRTLCLLWGALTTCPVSVLEFLRDTEHLVNEPPNANAEDPLVARLSQYIEDGACQSMSLADAIATLCEQAGLHHEVALRTVANSTPPAQKTKWSQTTVMPEHYLRIWATPVNAVQLAALPATERRMGDPAAHDLPRAAPFAEFGDDSPEQVARQIAAVSATITSDPREITAAVYLGGQQEIEVSLLLRPGWPPHQYLDAPLTATERAEAREYWTERFNPEYETTLGGRRPRSQYHGQHPNHAAVADVGRLWIFPDDPRTIDAPALARGEDTIWGWLWDAVRYAVYQPAPLDYLLWWEHPTLGGGISPGLAAEMVPARRPFGPTISRKSDATTDTSPIVRVHFGRNSNGDYTRTIPEPNDAGWVEFAGQVEISADRAAIRLVDDNLLSAPAFREDPKHQYGNRLGRGLMLHNYIEGHFWVQVTCTIRLDQRLWTAAGVPGSVRERWQVRDLGHERFGMRLRRTISSGLIAGNSYLATRTEEDPNYDNTNSRGPLAELADRRAKQLAGTKRAGQVELFYLDGRYRPGDVFTGCSGLGLSWERYPHIDAVKYSNPAGAPRTTLIVTDRRHTPEGWA